MFSSTWTAGSSQEKAHGGEAPPMLQMRQKIQENETLEEAPVRPLFVACVVFRSVF